MKDILVGSCNLIVYICHCLVADYYLDALRLLYLYRSLSLVFFARSWGCVKMIAALNAGLTDSTLSIIAAMPEKDVMDMPNEGHK